MAHQVEIWTVAAGGGRRGEVSAPSRLGLGPCDHAVRLTDGSCLLGRHTTDPAHTNWKGYAGGAAGQLWHVSPKTADAEAACARVRLPAEWNVGEPWFYGGRIYFVSDHDGVSNIYSMPAPSRAADASAVALALASVVMETAHAVMGAREPSVDASGGNGAVYHCNGQLHCLELGANAAPIPLTLELVRDTAEIPPRYR